MFYRKEIKALELRVERHEAELETLRQEVAYLKGVVNALATSMTVVQFDADEHIAALKANNVGENEAHLIAQMNEDYSRKLRRFIRQTTSKKKIVKNGKENPKATE